MNKITLIVINIVVFNFGFLLLANKDSKVNEPAPPIVRHDNFTPITLPPAEPYNPAITTKIPGYLNYQMTVAQLKKWNSEAPDLTEVGTYGKSSRGTDIYYIRINNKEQWGMDKPCVMITACIHGNEPLSSSVVMGYIGTILDKYGDDPEITKLVNERDMYFVPVLFGVV